MGELESAIAEWVSNVEKNGRHCLPVIVDAMINKGYPFDDVKKAIDALLKKGILAVNDGWLDFEFLKDGSDVPYPDMVQLMLDSVMGKKIPKEPDIVCHQVEIEANKKKPHDPVNFPKHYNLGKISVADFIADQGLNFDRGTCVKYLCRAGTKDDVELNPEEKAVQDLEKAIWYLNHEINWIKKNGLSR